MFFTQKVGISKEMIQYNGKTIPSQSIIGIGMAIISFAGTLGKNVGLLGGLLGRLIDRKIDGNDSSFRGNLMITYKPSGQEKIRVAYIGINTADPVCRKMLEKVIQTYKKKFIGSGSQLEIQEKLKAPQNKIIIITIIAIILGILAFITYGYIKERYGHPPITLDIRRFFA